MGGGDLNSKKSWHPNTIKNQERVWKAEQAAAEEKKRIMELQRERAEEKDRAELNEMVKRNAACSASDNRLNWMYEKPDKKIQDEDYLLGKSIEKNYGHSEKDEQDVIPAVARRVVGSSMLSTSGDGQVDLARKMREDPLLLVKERERAARAALLNNPLQRRRLADLLRKEQEQKKSKVKQKSKKKGNDLDEKLAAKLCALGGDKCLDIAKLLDSESDSSSDSDEKHSKKKKKKKEKNKSKKSKKKVHSDSDERSSEDIQRQSKNSKKKGHSESDDSISEKRYKQKKSKHSKERNINDKYAHSHKSEPIKRKSETDVSDFDAKKRREHSSNREPRTHDKSSHRRDCSEDGRHKRTKTLPEPNKRIDTEKRKGGGGLSAEEKAAKLAEMAAAGAEREVQRARRVDAQRRADAAAPPPPPRTHAQPLPDSLESRIHSNRHYIQRDRHHMNENFARRH